MNIRTRMAPSPTGNLHLGTAYATLWPFLLARKHKGTFVLRIEDTDQARSTKEFAENILNGLKWLDLNWDEGPFYQMDRLAIYKTAAEKLLSEGKAYYCFCTKEELEEEKKQQVADKKPQIYSGKCRNLTKTEAEEKVKSGSPYVVRYKLPEGRGKVEFEDLIHGKVLIDPTLLGDMVIMRGNGIPLYNFAVVVDDIDMKITHILRGDDHLSNTPKQILFFEALGGTIPQYGHYPMILNQDRVGKLSKRTGSTSLEDYKKDGYLPEALVNYLALLGWTPSNDREVLTLEELIEEFDVKDMNESASAWNEQKLDWINGEYIRSLSDEELAKRIEEYLQIISQGNLGKSDKLNGKSILQVIPLIKERIKKLSDFVPLTDFIFEEPEYEQSLFEQVLKERQKDLLEILNRITNTLESMGENWNTEKFESDFRKLAEELDLSSSQMFQIIRLAVSGQLVTPPLFESIKLIGEKEILQRIKDLPQKLV